MIRRLKRWFWRILLGGEMQEYFQRFMEPQVTRLRAAGATDEEIQRFIESALRVSPKLINIKPPAALLKDAAILYEKGLPAFAIIKYLEEWNDELQ